jgi:hypothetical protein
MLAVGRIAAALVAVGLSGSLQLPPAKRDHRVAAQACRCGSHHGGHACSSPACHRARSQDVAKFSPCHEAAAQQKLAREERSLDFGGPCMEGSCGHPESPQASGTRVAESFTIPEPTRISLQSRSEVLAVVRDAAYGVSKHPDTPPPRIG